jgi:signal transduction histidine kinase
MWNPNKQRIFGIRRYFTIAGAVVLLPAMALVWFLIHYPAIEGLVEVEEGHHVAMAKTLSDIVWTRFSGYLNSASGTPGNELRARPEPQEIHKLLRQHAEGLSILQIKIYDTEGIILYSSEASEASEASQIGERASGHHYLEILDTIREGKPRSRLSYSSRITGFFGDVLDRDIIETYVPLKNRTGDFMAVFEVYSDVTYFKERIDIVALEIIAGVFLVLMLFYGTLVFVVMRRAIAPLHLASEQASTIGPRSSGVRLPTRGMPKEVMPLIEATNGALDRRDRALDMQRRFIADAAHEMLTPFAALSLELDAIEDKKVAAAMKTDVEAASALVTQLLELSQLDSLDTTEDEPVDIRETCLEVIATMAPTAYAQGKTLSLTGSEKGLKVRCSPDMLSRALRNLVENAIVHTPVNTSVEVNLQDDGAIRVIDEGPGVPAAERNLVFQRFWRGRKKNRPGAGLGLSIVKRFVDAYGGTVEIDDGASGGAVFTICLPTVENG